MFQFFFKIPKPKNDWLIIINEHKIECAKKTAETISKAISKFNKKNKNAKSYSITIPELENSFICSESDYEYFENIFTLVTIQISSTNCNVLKIFAEKLEIEELSSMIKIFESYDDIISNYKPIQDQRDLTNELIDIEEDTFDALLNHFDEIEKSEDNIITQDFIYHLFFTVCVARPMKIEILLKFLKKYEEKTNGTQFEYFKKELFKDFKIAYKLNNTFNNDTTIETTLYSTFSSKSAYFILNYLCNIGEIKEESLKEYESVLSKTEYSHWFFRRKNDNDKNIKDFTKEEIEEYKRTGYNPSPIYQAIKNDDLESFTQLMTQKTSTKEFNNQITLLKFERNPDLLFQKKSDYDLIRNLELAAAYGSEKIFNYILLNISDVQIEPITVRMSFIGRNSTIIHKCLDVIEMDNNLLEMCLIITIKYNYYELFEWLYEDNEGMKNKKVFDHLIKNAIKFNNMDVVLFLLKGGFDYTPLFMLSMIYDQFLLTDLATKLPYDRNIPNTPKKSFQPYTYRYEDTLPLFVAIYKSKIKFVDMLIKRKKFDPKVKCDSVGPLYFSLIYKKIDVFKYLMTDSRFSLFHVYQTMNMFEVSILKDEKEIADILLQKLDIKNILGIYSYSYLKSVEIRLHCNITYESFSHRYNFESYHNYTNINKEIDMNYPIILIHYLTSESNDNKTDELKKKIIQNDLIFLTCLAARYCSEKDFENFLDSFPIDINAKIPDTSVTPLFASILNNKHDTLNLILTKFKDTIDINCSAKSNFMPIHLLCDNNCKHDDRTLQLFLEIKNLKINQVTLVQMHNHTSAELSPLHLAIVYKNKQMVEKLIKLPGIDVDESETTKSFHTIFEDAISHNFFKYCDFIIEHAKKPLLTEYSLSQIAFNEESFTGNFCRFNYNDKNYPSNLIQYFIRDAENKKVTEMKYKTIDENEPFFACLAAQYTNTNDFETFLEKHGNFDINDFVPGKIFFINIF